MDALAEVNHLFRIDICKVVRHAFCIACFVKRVALRINKPERVCSGDVARVVCRSDIDNHRAIAARAFSVKLKSAESVRSVADGSRDEC